MIILYAVFFPIGRERAAEKSDFIYAIFEGYDVNQDCIIARCYTGSFIIRYLILKVKKNI